MVSSFGLAGESGIYLWSMILLMLVIVMAFAPCSTRRSSSSPTDAYDTLPVGASDHRDRDVVHPPEHRPGLEGARPTSVDSILPKGEVFTIGGVAYTWDKLIVLLFTVPVLVLMLLVQRTRQGKAMRATARIEDASAMMGINVNRTISFTFFLAGGWPAPPAPLRPVHHQHPVRRGFSPRPDRLHGAVVGGIGNLPGAVLGGS